MSTVRDATLGELDPATLYRILALRTDVFVVEQDCAYPELDGRDLEASARQLWIERDGAVLATLRLLRDGDGSARIGRVATAAHARGEGLAANLMQRALELAGTSDIVLNAQTYLLDWYARFGFVRDGEDYLEDGIAHVPMRRRLKSGPVAGPAPGAAVVASDPISDDPAELGMTAHPEGGWYRETWRHTRTVRTPRGERPLATAVAFLLRPGECSAWHRVASDELWLWQGGGAVRLTLGGDGASPVATRSIELGPGAQHLVPAKVWQRAEPVRRSTLVACIVSPGFDFDDLTLAE